MRTYTWRARADALADRHGECARQTAMHESTAPRHEAMVVIMAVSHSGDHFACVFVGRPRIAWVHVGLEIWAEASQ